MCRQGSPSDAITVEGDIAYVQLTRGKVAIIDAADVPKVAQVYWSAYCTHHLWYANNRRLGGMHRIVLGLDKGDPRIVDHINGNGLDNRKPNLRLCDTRRNMQNSLKRRVTDSGRVAKSAFKGVTRTKGRSVWRAKISPNGKRIDLGQYPTEVEAARAYDAAARKYFGEFARLNFPDDIAA